MICLLVILQMDILLKERERRRTVYFGESTARCFRYVKIKIEYTPSIEICRLKKPFIVHTNASIEGLGAMLYQEQDGVQRATAYFICINTDTAHMNIFQPRFRKKVKDLYESFPSAYTSCGLCKSKKKNISGL